MKKDVEVRCPDCGSTILVDVITGTVLRHRKKGKEKTERAVLFDEIAENVVDRRKKIPSAFEDAFSTVKKRTSGLDDVFHDAIKKVEKVEKERREREAQGEDAADEDDTTDPQPREP